MLVYPRGSPQKRVKERTIKLHLQWIDQVFMGVKERAGAGCPCPNGSTTNTRICFWKFWNHGLRNSLLTYLTYLWLHWLHVVRYLLLHKASICSKFFISLIGKYQFSPVSHWWALNTVGLSGNRLPQICCLPILIAIAMLAAYPILRQTQIYPIILWVRSYPMDQWISQRYPIITLLP